jgi:hypothetical protein
MSVDPLERAWLADDRLESLESFAIKEALWILGRVVGKEAISEDVCRCLNSQTSEGTIEEIGVGVDRVLEAKTSERVHHCKVITVRALGHVIESLELAQVQRVRVSTGSYGQHTILIHDDSIAMLYLRDIKISSSG